MINLEILIKDLDTYINNAEFYIEEGNELRGNYYLIIAKDRIETIREQYPQINLAIYDKKYNELR